MVLQRIGYIWVSNTFTWSIQSFVSAAAAAAAKSLQSCPTLYDPIDGSLPGSPVPGILQVRTLEWVAISFSNAWKWKVKVGSHLVVSDSQRPLGLQPTRLLRPWDFPGKSTGVGCHCLVWTFTICVSKTSLVSCHVWFFNSSINNSDMKRISCKFFQGKKYIYPQ